MKKNPPAILPPSMRALPARSAFAVPWLACALALALASSVALAQTAGTQEPAPTAAPAAPTAVATPAAAVNAAPTLESLGWLHGCWDGKVNQRDFREEWMPLRGDMMIGVSHTVSQGKTQDFEYLRLESRPEGVFYVAVPSGKKETSFRFSDRKQEGDGELFTFESVVDEFPQRIIYRRGSEGWLYAHVEGKLNGQPRSVIYPMRRVDCKTGELIRQ